MSAGGAQGSGGMTGDGGSSGTGGSRGDGGATASGGTASGGVTGRGGGNGGRGDGGAPGSGGTSSGGVTGRGGGSGGMAGAGGGTDGGLGAGGAGGAGDAGPCDIFAAAGMPCVAAHSVVRSLYKSYGGKLYQVRRSDSTTKDITALSPGGIADTSTEDAFCSGSCVVTVLYDQSTHGNDLWYQGSTQVPAAPAAAPAKAGKETLKLGGHSVHSLYLDIGNCYWHDGSKSGMPTGKQPEGIYMVANGKHYNGGCCFDYGNSETNRRADACGAMDAVYFGTDCWFSSQGAKCQGSGPWVMADLECGMFTGGSTSVPNTQNISMTSTYVTAMLKNDGTNMALKGGNAQAGALTTLYSGKIASGWTMAKQGAIDLGCGGDCCPPHGTGEYDSAGGVNASVGTFYEGAIVAGYPTDAVDDAVQSNIIAAGYGQ